MRIINRYYYEWTIEEVVVLKSFGLYIKEGYDRLDIEENEENRPIVNKIESWGAKRFSWAEYDRKDYAATNNFVYGGSWTNGYPMPDDDFGYLQNSYELSEYCTLCGIGKKQIKPIFLKKEPKWGSRMLFSVNWIPDEIFCRKELYDLIFKRIGIESSPVLLFKSNKRLESTVQLRIPVSQYALLLDGHSFDVCHQCRRKKYLPLFRGFYPKFQDTDRNEHLILKSQEWFGSGGGAHQNISLHRTLLDQLKKQKANLQVWPVSP